MNKDIMGKIPVVGDVIVRAKYARDNSLHVCMITGFTKMGYPKVDQYSRNGYGQFSKRTVWDITGTIQGDFLILNNIQL